MGFRQDIKELVRIADLYVHPSFSERLPISVMEAMVVKVSVICSDIQECGGLIEEKFLFQLNNKNEIIDKINEVGKCLKFNKEVEIIEKIYAHLQGFGIFQVTEKSFNCILGFNSI